MFVGGMAAFGVASLFCGVGQSPAELVAARLLQGLTAAPMVPQVLALIGTVFPGSERARALSLFGVTIGVGAVAGQILGGLLLNADLFGLGWRVIFFVNLPVAAVTAAIALRLLPAHEARPREMHRSGTHRRSTVDPVGAIGISVSLALALVPLTLGRSQGWPAWAWISLLSAAPAIAVVLGWERRLAARGGQPILDVALFRDPSFNWDLGTSVAVFASFFGFVFSLTLVLQDGLGLSPLQAGLTFAPLGVAFSGASIAARPLITRFGPRVISLGTAVAALGLLTLILALRLSGSSVGAAALIPSMIAIGLGNGTAIPPLIGAVLARIRTNAGTVAAILTTAQQFAAASGVAGVGAVFFALLGAAPVRASYTDALQWAAGVSCGLAVVATALTTPLTKATRATRV
jgi:MFS family permease